MYKLTVLLFLLSFSVSADVFQSIDTFNKQRNSWAIEVDEDLGSEVTKESFYEIIEKVYALYGDNDLNRNLELGIVDWKVPYMSAWAFENDAAFTINFWGGFARIPGMTDRALALTVCHEIGHVLGGRPLHSNEQSKNMSAEGQADYFAASTCMKKYLKHYSIQEEVSGLSTVAASKCYEGFSEIIERNNCYEIAKSGQDLANVVSFLHSDQVFSYETPSNTVVLETLYDSYPSIQCRLDTYLIGALAPYPLPEDKDYRPACWFLKD